MRDFLQDDKRGFQEFFRTPDQQAMIVANGVCCCIDPKPTNYGIQLILIWHTLKVGAACFAFSGLQKIALPNSQTYHLLESNSEAWRLIACFSSIRHVCWCDLISNHRPYSLRRLPGILGAISRPPDKRIWLSIAAFRRWSNSNYFLGLLFAWDHES